MLKKNIKPINFFKSITFTEKAKNNIKLKEKEIILFNKKRYKEYLNNLK